MSKFFRSSSFIILKLTVRAYIFRGFSLFLEPFYKYYFSKLRPNYSNIENVIWIDPKNVKGFYIRERFSEVSFPGILCNKNWSGYIIEKEQYIKDSEKYTSMKEHFIDKISWEETTTFKRLKNLDKFSLQLLKYGSYEGALEYHKKYDKLFLELKKDGFRTPNLKEKISPMYINIGPNGEIYWTDDGNHRFFMALLLDIKIPVIVLRRHKEWQIKKDKHLVNNKYEQYSNHPDIIQV